MQDGNTNTREQQIKAIDALNDLVWQQRGNPAAAIDNPMQKGANALEQALALNYLFGVARCKLNLGMGNFIVQNNIPLAFQLLNEAVQHFKELNDKKWIANALLMLGIVNNSTGNSEAALYNAVKGFEFYENTTNTDIQDLTMAYYVIGTVYKDLKKYTEAEKYLSAGVLNCTSGTSWDGRIYTALSNIYNETGKYKQALELALKSLTILQNEQNNLGISRALNDIGIIYKNLNNHSKALIYFFESLKIREDIGVKPFVLGTILEIANTYIQANNINEALIYFLKAETIALETNHQVRLSSIYQNVANLYKLINNYAEALNYYEKYIQLAIQLNNADKETKINKLQNTLIQEKEQEIERLKNVELKNAYTLISEKNKEITDSIQYACRIQTALLVPHSLLKANLNEYFVLFNPKDIVSGDFYWATEHNNKFYLAVCDSTGHGVPGAFMSLLNMGFLSEAIKEKNIEQPNQVLDYVRQRLINSIGSDGQQDGMDGILICIEQTSNIHKNSNAKITYAAANNQPILISPSNLETNFIQLPKDKMPIGKGEKNQPFTLHTINAQPGDTLYLYTDGYADQFGGPKAKKFKYKTLNELLLKISTIHINEQATVLNQQLQHWKGNLEQVDDILIIGIKL